MPFNSNHRSQEMLEKKIQENSIFKGLDCSNYSKLNVFRSENQNTIQNNHTFDNVQPSKFPIISSEILSKSASVKCEAPFTEIETSNAEYEKERKLNLSVLYGIPASKIKKTTPKKVSKFFKKISLPSAVHEIPEVAKFVNVGDRRKNTEVTSTAIADDNDSNNEWSKDNVINGKDDSQYKDNTKILQLRQLEDDGDMLQYQSKNCNVHEYQIANACEKKTIRTYDEFSFQAIQIENLHHPHTKANLASLMTCNSLRTDSERDETFEYESKFKNKNEHEIDNKNESRSEITTAVCDDCNEVEIIVPYQLTSQQARAHTRHEDNVKSVMTRIEQQPIKKKRLVGSSKPFSRSGPA